MIAKTNDPLTREVPTHLFRFQEKIFGFWTIPQLMIDTVAAVGVWYLWNYPLPFLIRIALCAIYTLLVLLIVHVPVKGMSFLDWIWLHVRYFAVPSKTVWQAEAAITLLQREGISRTMPSVQSTWVPLHVLKNGYMGFAARKGKKGEVVEPERYCLVFEVEGINLSLLSTEEQVGILGRYETFLAGLQFPLQTYSSNETIDIGSYAPIQAQEKQLRTLGSTPRLQALARASLHFQRKQLATCMLTRHFVIVNMSTNEIALQSKNGKSPSLLSILFTFAFMKRKSMQAREEVLQQLRIRADVVKTDLMELGLNLTQLDDSSMAQFYASTLAPGCIVLRFPSLHEARHPIYRLEKTQKQQTTYKERIDA